MDFVVGVVVVVVSADVVVVVVFESKGKIAEKELPCICEHK